MGLTMLLQRTRHECSRCRTAAGSSRPSYADQCVAGSSMHAARSVAGGIVVLLSQTVTVRGASRCMGHCSVVLRRPLARAEVSAQRSTITATW